MAPHAASTVAGEPTTLADAFRTLASSPEGLTAAEAQRRLAQYGRNEPAATAGRSLVVQLVLLVANPLVLILLFASGIAFLAGQQVDAAIIVAMVALGLGLNFVQTFRSSHAVERLRASVATQATVRRDGGWVDVPRWQVAPGDVVRLTAGDVAPADAYLLEARDLHAQEAALTGESLPVAKEAAPLDHPITPGDVGPHVVYLGTSIVSGSGAALVYATGPATTFGALAARLAAAPPETQFERGTRAYGYLVMRTATLLVLFVLAVSILLHRDPLESLLFAVALAVGMTPEFLPVITAVTLSRGAVRMAERQVVVKNLSAIQNLGSMDILCSDKTGTLTAGAVAVAASVDARGAADDAVVAAAYWNSYHETGIRSPLDAAILQAPQPAGDVPPKLDELPFDFERKRLSVVVQVGDERRLIAKGAPEMVVPACTEVLRQGVAVPLDPAARAAATATEEGLSRQGYRVLAVAQKAVAVRPRYSTDDECDLTLVGFLAFADPVDPDAAAVLQRLRADGVEVKVISGDNELVAQQVCRQVGLDADLLVTGAEIARLDDVALGQVAERNVVFARVTPEQKNRIILALKRRGHTVGFMGDGINDAPSLHAADVGIAAPQAVDVAKDAASIILLRPGLAVLHEGILQGRQAFGNVIKYLLMGTSSAFGNMFSMAAASVVLPFLPMLPTQILLNNFLYDLAQITIPTDRVDATYMRKPRHWDVGLIRDFMVFVGPVSSLFDLLTFWVLLQVFRAGEAEFHTGWFVESLATQALVLFVIRTAGNPFASRPSPALAATVVAVVAVALGLPFTPLAPVLGFVALPPAYYLFLGSVVAVYLSAVEVVKRRLMARLAT